MGKAIKFEFGFHGMISVPPTEEYQMDLSETFIFGNNSPSREEEEEERGKFEFLLGEIGGQPEAPKEGRSKRSPGHYLGTLFDIFWNLDLVCTSIFQVISLFWSFHVDMRLSTRGGIHSAGGLQTRATRYLAA
jgi:hypothetical protein